MGLRANPWTWVAGLPVLPGVVAAGGAVGLWALPMVGYGFGGAGVLVWGVLVVVLAIPLLLFEQALGSCLRGSAAGCMRRVHRRAEWVGFSQVVLALLVGAASAVLGVWALVLAMDGLIDLLGGVPSPWEGGLGAVRAQASSVVGSAVPVADAGLELPGLRPHGAVLVVGALAWVLLHRLMRGGVPGLRAVAAVSLPVLLAMQLALLAIALATPGAGLGLERMLAVDPRLLVSPAVWLQASTGLLLVATLGTGTLTTLAQERPLPGDLPAASLLIAGVGLLCLFGWLLLAAFASGGVAFAEGVRDPGIAGPVDLLLVVLPTGLAAAVGGGMMGTLAAVLTLAAVALAALLATLSLLQGPLMAIERGLCWSRAETTNALAVAGLLLGLPFATPAGGGIWELAIDALRLVVVPLVVAAVLWVVVRGIGLDGVMDHIRVHAAHRPGRWWRSAVGLVLPVWCLAMAILGVIDLVQRGGTAPLAMLLVPLVGLPLVGWILARQRRREGGS